MVMLLTNSKIGQNS